MAKPSSGDVSGRYSGNAATKAGSLGKPKASTPWSGGRPNDAGHTRTAGAAPRPSNTRPDNIFGGTAGEPGSHRKDHK